MPSLPPLSSLSSRLRFRHLRLVIALHEHGTVQHAANEVSLTQPGATRALNEIEDILGSQLFKRTNRGLETTELGLCVVRYARLIYTDIEYLRDEMKGIIKGRGGRLSIGIIMGAVPLITKAIAQIYQDQQDLSIQVVEDTSGRLLSLLEKGRLDVAIGRVKASQRNDLFESTAIHSESLCVISHPNHPLAQKKSLHLHDLHQVKWVLYPANMPMRLLLEREFHENALEFPSNPIETASAFTTLTMMQSDHNLVALMSRDAALPFLKAGMICQLPLTLASRSEPYELITLKGATLKPITKLFMEKVCNLGSYTVTTP